VEPPQRGSTTFKAPQESSVDGWSNDREVAIYTAGADQAELGRTALTARPIGKPRHWTSYSQPDSG